MSILKIALLLLFSIVMGSCNGSPGSCSHFAGLFHKVEVRERGSLTLYGPTSTAAAQTPGPSGTETTPLTPSC